MLIDLGLVFNALLAVLGAIWCYHMFGRWHSDLAELRELDDWTPKLIIIGFWVVTLVIALLLVNFAVNLVRNIVDGVQNF